MFTLAMEVCFKTWLSLIQAMFLSQELTKSVFFFWDTRYFAYVEMQGRTDKDDIAKHLLF